MPKMVITITSHTEKWFDIAEAWQKVGASGVTIIDSYGLYTVQQGRRNIELPQAILSMASILRRLEKTSKILFSIVPDSDLADRLIDEAQTVLGDLDLPNNGIAFVIDVEKIVGLRGPDNGG